MNGIPIWQVDSFTKTLFRGNPAGVCLLDEAADPAWMQAVAAEMNLSETAFLLRRESHEFSIRWFTPTVEVPLCGHATLASAHVLWSEDSVSGGASIRFHAASGPLTADREGDWIRLDFPALIAGACPMPVGLAEALGCEPIGVSASRFGTYLAELGSEKEVRALEPDSSRLSTIGHGMCIVTSRSDTEACDFVSRFFAPGVGIPEDPVTGAAHCSLGPYWAERLGRSELVGHQLSKRGGVVRVRVRGERVDLLGQAVTVLRGEILP